MLLKDRETADAAIATVRAGPPIPPDEPLPELPYKGPYRHHGQKWLDYMDQRLSAFARAAGRPLAGLDLGCGVGRYHAWLRRYVAELYGGDYNLRHLLRARRVGQARRVFLADAANFPMRDGIFDVVFCTYVLAQVPDDAKALAEAHRMLKPGGLFILAVANNGAWLWRLASRLQPHVRRASRQAHFYTAGEILEKCRAAGFTVHEIRRFGYGLPHWGLDQRLRQFKPVDDLFEAVGRAVIPSQAITLVLMLGK